MGWLRALILATAIVVLPLAGCASDSPGEGPGVGEVLVFTGMAPTAPVVYLGAALCDLWLLPVWAMTDDPGYLFPTVQQVHASYFRLLR